jgi:hypothetical protein
MGLSGDANAANYGQYARSFGTDQFEQDPGYAFRQSEGLKGLDRSASARGGILSGGALKNIQRFGQDLASQEYQNAFNRYQTERAARLNTLGGLTASGQSASNVMTGAAGQLGQNSAANALERARATTANSLGRGAATSNLAVNRGLTTGNLATNLGTATGNIAMNRGATTGNLALQRGATTSANALNLGEATAGLGLSRANATTQNLMNQNAAARANDAAYYGTVGDLTLGRGQNTAQNAYNVANAVSGGAMNVANAASQGAYNVGNAQATGAMNTGAARASGYIGQANALTNALGQIGNYAAQAPMNNAMMAYYRNNTPAAPATPVSTTPYFSAGQGPQKLPFNILNLGR